MIAGMVFIEMSANEVVDIGWIHANNLKPVSDSIFRPDFNCKAGRIYWRIYKGTRPASINQDIYSVICLNQIARYRYIA